MMGGMKAPEDLLRRIRQGNRFLLTSHANPDGDAEVPANQCGQGGHAVPPTRSSRAKIPSGAWVAATIRPPLRRWLVIRPANRS